jgi:hypothetical protein
VAMSMSEDQQNRWIATALRSVTAASKVRTLFGRLKEGHRQKTSENEQMTREYLEDTIRSAMEYGYPVEAVAGAASMTVDQIAEITDGSAAA